jgi:hypothetical protein
VLGLPIEPTHEVHGLARLLWEMLSARRLFQGRDDFEMLIAIRNSALPEPLLPPALGYLEPILRRALAAEAGRRHAGPGELVAEIEATGAPMATRAEIGAWLAAIDPAALADQAALLARAAAARPPAHGYLVLALLEYASNDICYLAVRPGPRGNEPVVLRRLHRHFAEDPVLVEHFLSEAALSIEGIARVDDAGVDQLGGVFRAQPFVHGLDVRRILRAVASRATVPPPIALAIACAAGRALEAALHLPGGAGMILRDLAPGSLRIGVDGRPIWTSIGVAPRAELTAIRRSMVPLALGPNVVLDGSVTRTAPPARVSRFVVVPRGTRPGAQAAPRPRWWRE